ncbi:MAG: DEAD/DEAH box helicase [Gammaproteobacteria bacterium]|nr:MAG: DEAD/DEAH box helicase [Gammaproteobacteria bacterium]
MPDWDLSQFQVPEEPGRSRFHDFALPLPLMHAIADLGFEHCTPIQSEVLPFSLADYDVTGQAQTGTGKTAAFLITILARQYEFPSQGANPPGSPRALILAPTRELAIQIEHDGHDLAKHLDSRVINVVGGMDMNRQRERLSQGVDILVATPGRLLDFMDRRVIDLRRVDVLVIDEADRMLDMGFIPDVRRIVYKTPHKRQRQTLFFSATFNEDVMRLASQWTLQPHHVAIRPENVAVDTVEQKFWLVAANEKSKVLHQLVVQKDVGRVMVFANRRDQTRNVHDYLRRKGVSCEMLSGEVPQRKRLTTLDRFKQGKVRVLVATDVAGRGIHVDDVSHVVNYDLPEDPEDYVHRIGRTGRAGATGISISFVSEDDAFNLPAIEQFIGYTVVCSQPEL